MMNKLEENGLMKLEIIFKVLSYFQDIDEEYELGTISHKERVKIQLEMVDEVEKANVLSEDQLKDLRENANTEEGV